jgi:hypothetical protein
MEMKKIKKGEHKKIQALRGGSYCKRGLKKRNAEN